jgi:hypothetical protein
MASCSLSGSGVVQVPLWRPDHEPLPPGELAKVAIYGGVGRVR